MKSKKLFKFVSLVVALCMVFSLTAFAVPKNNPEDNDEDDAKKFVIKNGIFKGNGNGDYDWENYVKRGDLTLMIVRAFHLNMINKGDFEDVDKKDYYSDAIATAKAYGIAKGDGKKFYPKKYVTIGEAILIIERSVKVANSNVVVDRNIDLDELYKGENYNAFATRALIAEMLDDVFSGNGSEDEKDTGLIEYEVGVGEDFVNFNDVDFNKVFGDLVDEKDKDETLSYVKFSLPSTSKGTLYYEYDIDDDTNVGVKVTDKYYVNKNGERLIDEVSFVPAEGFAGEFEFKYTAYKSLNDDLYEGLIKITVAKDRDFDLNTINYSIKENKTKAFNDRDFLNVFNQATDNEEIDFIEFELPEATIGTLYYNVDNDKIFEDSEKVEAGKEFELSEIDEIIFVPQENFVGNALIEYTIVDKSDDSYNGIVKINVSEDYLIDKIKFETDQDDTDGFGFDLEKKLSDLDEGYNFETIKFTSLPLAGEGELSIGNDPAEEDIEYEIADLDDLTFVADNGFDGTISIEYIAVDDDANAFHGVIEIVVTK